MNWLALVVFTLLTFGSTRADILANGDFSDGKAHWKGDLRLASLQQTNDVSVIDHPNTTPGIIVDLKSHVLAKVWQTFNSHETSFNYKVTYQLSDDYAPSPAVPSPPAPPHNPMDPNGPINPFLSQLLNASVSADVNPPSGNDILLLIIDMSNLTLREVHLKTNPTVKEPQTATGTLTELGAHDEKTFYLIFSPGKGSVTLLNVTLSPVDDQKSAPNDRPFR